MKIDRNYTVVLSGAEYSELLAILAYVNGSVEYAPDAKQPEILKKKASQFWNELRDADMDYARIRRKYEG